MLKVGCLCVLSLIMSRIHVHNCHVVPCSAMSSSFRRFQLLLLALHNTYLNYGLVWDFMKQLLID